jgi:hypothetical protein
VVVVEVFMKRFVNRWWKGVYEKVVVVEVFMKRFVNRWWKGVYEKVCK